MIRTLPLYDRAAVRSLDAAAARGGLPGSVLMERAGEAVISELRRRDWLPAGEGVLVLCGPGQNGGDGWVVAGRLAREGLTVTVLTAREPADLGGDAHGAARAALAEPGLRVVVAPAQPSEIAELPLWDEADLIVDALFGIGLDRAPAPPYAAMLAAADRRRRAGARAVAVDVPTGVIADDGRVPGAVFGADLTVTVGIDKLGLHVWPGAGAAGEVVVADIGYPPALVAALVPAAALATGLHLPPPPADTHKGRQGSVVVVAGSAAMPGAAALAARAALRGGAGRVTVASETAGLAALPPEVMRRALADRWCAVDRASLRDAVAAADAIVVGPGLGYEGAEVVGGLLAEWSNRPVVIDADALHPDLLPPAAAARPWVLTPHPGEAARLLGCDAAGVQADRIGTVRRLAERRQAVVVLKGAGSLIAEPDGRLIVSPWALPQLAVPGSGDVLAGLTAALLAGGSTAAAAAAAAVWAHGMAAQRRRPGLLAGELADALPAVLWP